MYEYNIILCNIYLKIIFFIILCSAFFFQIKKNVVKYFGNFDNIFAYIHLSIIFNSRVEPNYDKFFCR